MEHMYVTDRYSCGMCIYFDHDWSKKPTICFDEADNKVCVCEKHLQMALDMLRGKK